MTQAPEQADRQRGLDSEEARSYDAVDLVFRADPYPTYRNLRAEAPVHRGFLGIRSFARYADCVALLHDSRFGKDFTKSSLYDGVMKATAGNPPPFTGFGIEGGTKPFMLTDPPEHTRLRGVAAAAFTSVLERAVPGIVEGAVDELLDGVPGRFDFVEEVARPLPVRVLGDLLGIPEADRAQFTAWSVEVAAVQELDLNLPEEVAERRRKAVKDCVSYFRTLATTRRTAPGDDLVSELVSAGDADDGLSDLEVATTSVLMMEAGLEVTSMLLANGALVLARHPEAYARLVADPQLAESAVDEMLRFEPPAHGMGRIALEDVTIGDAEISQGDAVLIMIGSANRDEARFQDGDRFIIDRGEKGHLTFGAHIHRCLGAPLGELMAAAVFRGLADRFATLELTVDSPPIKDGFVFRGPSELPVVVARRETK